MGLPRLLARRHESGAGHLRLTRCIAHAVTIVFAAALVGGNVYAATVAELDRQAQRYFNQREYNQAIGLWLTCLEMEPDNEKIQQKIEMIYEIKQKKDVAYQRSRLNYRIARRKIKDPNDEEARRGIELAKQAISEYRDAFRLDPKDEELQAFTDDMKNLENEIRSAQERLRLSAIQRERVEKLKNEARSEMASASPDFEKARKLWREVLRYVPRDEEALEGEKNCTLAIENRLRYEKIRGYMERGVALFEKKDYQSAKAEFEEVIKIDPKYREAGDYLEKIRELLEEKLLYAQRLQQAEAFYNSGVKNLKENKFDEAKDDLESCVALVKNYRDAPQLLANIERMRKEFLERENERKLRLIDQKFQEGILAYTGGRYREAIDAFVTVLTLQKKNERAQEYLRRARDALRLEEEEYVDSNSPYYDVVESLITSGRSLFNRGEYAASRKKWESILNLFPKNRVAREYIIKCDMYLTPDSRDKVISARVAEGLDALKRKDYRNALRTFTIIKNIDNNYPDIDNLIARANAGLREGEEGNLTPADRAEIERRFRLGMDLYQAGGRENVEKALAQLRYVVQRDPANVRAVITLNKIESQLRIGGREGEEGRELTPRQRELVNKHYYAGINYYSNNNFQKAIEEWRKVLAIDPGHVKARNNIRKVLAFMGR